MANNRLRNAKSIYLVVTIIVTVAALSSCKPKPELAKSIAWVCDSLPDSEVDEIYMKTVNEILIENHVKYREAINIEIGLTKQQQKFLQPLYSNVNFINFRNDSLDPKPVVISIIWPPHVDSGQLSIGWSYSCGNTCAYSGVYVFQRYNDKWLLVDISKRSFS